MYNKNCPRSKFLIGESDLDKAFSDSIKKKKKQKTKAVSATTSVMTNNKSDSDEEFNFENILREENMREDSQSMYAQQLWGTYGQSKPI